MDTSTPADSTTPQPKRIVLVISSASLGGGETHCLLLLRCLQADRAFEPHVVCHPGGELEHIIKRMNVPVTPLEFEDLRRLPDAFRLAALIRRQRPDLVHAHLNRASLFASTLGRLAGATVLSTAHGLTRALYYRWAHHVIAVSDAVKRHLVAQVPGMATTTTVVHNGIPMQVTVNRERLRQLREQYFIQSDERVVAVVGKLHPNKGQHIAIRALKTLPPQLRVRLMLVGAGPAEDELRSLVNVLSLGPQVTFVPPQPRLYELYALSDFVVVPSKQEALSMVVLEALRQARPVIASDTGGIPEIIKPGFNGVLVPPDDHQALAGALEQGLRDYRRAETMAQAGQRTVAEQFSIEKCYLATRNCYLRAMSVPIA